MTCHGRFNLGFFLDLYGISRKKPNLGKPVELETPVITMEVYCLIGGVKLVIRNRNVMVQFHDQQKVMIGGLMMLSILRVRPLLQILTVFVGVWSSL